MRALNGNNSHLGNDSEEMLFRQIQNKDYEILSLKAEIQNCDSRLNELTNKYDSNVHDYQQIINDIKQENLLLAEQLQLEKAKNQKLISDNNALVIQLNTLSKAKQYSSTLTNFEEVINNMQKSYTLQLNDKEKTIYEVKQSYQNALQENEMLVHYVLEQLNYIDTIIDSNTSNTVQLGDNQGMSGLTGKAEFLSKHFEMLIQKVSALRRDSNIIEINAKLNELSKSHDQLFKDNTQLQIDYNTTTKQLETFFAETSNLLSQIYVNDNNNNYGIRNISLNEDTNEVKFQKIIHALQLLIKMFNSDNAELQNRLYQISDLFKETNKLLEQYKYDKEQLRLRNEQLERMLNVNNQHYYQHHNATNRLVKDVEMKDKHKHIRSLDKYVKDSKHAGNGGYAGKIVNRNEYKEVVRHRKGSKHNKNFEVNEKQEKELNKYLSKFSKEYNVGTEHNNTNYNCYYANDFNNDNNSNHSSFNEDEMDLSENNSVDWNHKGSSNNNNNLGKIYKHKK
jgi:hypothetical protein